MEKRVLSIFQSWITLAINAQTAKNALKLALVVGSILSLINQTNAILGPEKINWIKLCLTYCVPYLVSTYTSISKDLVYQEDAFAIRKSSKPNVE